MEWNFGGLPSELRQEQRAHFGVIPVPFERTTSYGRGAADGPRAIVAASQYVELFDEVYRIDPSQNGIWTAPPLPQNTDETIEAAIDQIYMEAVELLPRSKFLIFVGGEHSITFPIVRAYKEIFPKLSVLQIDAHADLRMEYEGSIYSHAAVMRRVVELCPLVQVGIRSLSEEEFNQIPKVSTTVIYAHEFAQDRQKAMQKILENLADPVYITFDLDGFDPSLLPATGTPEPGGLFWQETMDLLHAVFTNRRVVGADVVELSPIAGWPASDFVAAKLIYKMMAMEYNYGS